MVNRSCVYGMILMVFASSQWQVLRASRGFGVDGLFLEDVDLVAQHGLGFLDGAGGDFYYGGGVYSDGGHAPGFEVFFYVDYLAVAVQVDGVDGEAHGEGVDAVGGVDPEALAGGEVVGAGGH